MTLHYNTLRWSNTSHDTRYLAIHYFPTLARCALLCLTTQQVALQDVSWHHSLFHHTKAYVPAFGGEAGAGIRGQTGGAGTGARQRNGARAAKAKAPHSVAPQAPTPPPKGFMNCLVLLPLRFQLHLLGSNPCALRCRKLAVSSDHAPAYASQMMRWVASLGEAP